MALPSSGTITHAMIQEEFGGSNPIGLSEYYGVADGIPESGAISNSDFYGASAYVAPTISYLTSERRTDLQGTWRTGFGLADKTDFYHPEAGSTGGSRAFGTVTGYVGRVGGYDLLGVQAEELYDWTNWVKGSSHNDYDHITFTVANPFGTNPNWSRFVIQNSSGVWCTLDRYAITPAWKSNRFGVGVITFTRGGAAARGQLNNFNAVFDAINTARNAPFYFE